MHRCTSALNVRCYVQVFGADDGSTLVTTVGVLTEVPVMLSLVWICNRGKHLIDARHNPALDVTTDEPALKLDAPQNCDGGRDDEAKSPLVDATGSATIKVIDEGQGELHGSSAEKANV